MRRSRMGALALCLLVALTGCMQTTRTFTRVEFKPYSAAEQVQEKEGVVFESHDVQEWPATFYADVQMCNEARQPIIDSKGLPIMERISFAQSNQWWEKYSITNNTDHVLRLNRTIIRLFDPAGNEYEAVDKNEISATLLANRPCMTTHEALPRIKLIKMFDRNTEVLPKTTSTGWIAFSTASINLPGLWKVAIYEVPVEVDAAGVPTKTTHFEFRAIAKAYEEVWKGKELVSRTELQD